MGEKPCKLVLSKGAGKKAKKLPGGSHETGNQVRGQNTAGGNVQKKGTLLASSTPNASGENNVASFNQNEKWGGKKDIEKTTSRKKPFNTWTMEVSGKKAKNGDSVRKRLFDRVGPGGGAKTRALGGGGTAGRSKGGGGRTSKLPAHTVSGASTGERGTGSGAKRPTEGWFCAPWRGPPKDVTPKKNQGRKKRRGWSAVAGGRRWGTGAGEGGLQGAGRLQKVIRRKWWH